MLMVITIDPSKKNHLPSQKHTSGWMRMGGEVCKILHSPLSPWKHGSKAGKLLHEQTPVFGAGLQKLSQSILEASVSMCGIPCSYISACGNYLSYPTSLRQKQ